MRLLLCFRHQTWWWTTWTFLWHHGVFSPCYGKMISDQLLIMDERMWIGSCVTFWFLGSFFWTLSTWFPVLYGLLVSSNIPHYPAKIILIYFVPVPFFGSMLTLVGQYHAASMPKRRIINTALAEWMHQPALAEWMHLGAKRHPCWTSNAVGQTIQSWLRISRWLKYLNWLDPSTFAAHYIAM